MTWNKFEKFLKNDLVKFSNFGSTKRLGIPCLLHSTTPCRIYRIPSALRSQTTLGEDSTREGDHLGTPCVECIFSFFNANLSYIIRQIKTILIWFQETLAFDFWQFDFLLFWLSHSSPHWIDLAKFWKKQNQNWLSQILYFWGVRPEIKRKKVHDLVRLVDP
jgi:hypothetical protein